MYMSILRIITAVALILAIIWWFGMKMPGRNISKAAALTADELALREELRRDVRTLAGDIGERNLSRYPALMRAAEFIEESLGQAGYQTRRDSYDVRGLACHNIETEIRGSSDDILVVGAHYDSVWGCPGANDNGTGVAATLALARRLRSTSPRSTIRFVAFVNEEPPFFQTPAMGSYVYASRCKQRGDRITGMITLETIGCFSDAPNSQRYPAPGLGLFYPTVGNFIGFVADTSSRRFLKRTMSIFRAQKKIPSEGAALPNFVPGVGWSDHWSFSQHGYPALMITDTAPFRYAHYHSATDTPDKLDYDRFALVVSAMQNVIVDLSR
jgi:Iap family predicted aminopeptidase